MDFECMAKDVNRCVKRASQLGVVAVLIVLAASLVLLPAHAGTPYEAQIGGFMTATLQTLITGEFAGRSPSNADAALHRPVCRPDDYEDLRAAANDRAAFDAFRRRCKLVEGAIDATHVHSTAYLPPGYCEKLKEKLKGAFEKALAERVYLARGAGLEVTCQDDGAIRVSAPRKRPGRRGEGL